MPAIEIRPAVEADIPIIAHFEHSYKSNYVWQMDYSRSEGHLAASFREIRLPRPVTVEYPRAARGLLEDWAERTALLVGCLGGTPVGYISVSDRIAPTTAWVTDMVVTAEIRRRGVGTALLYAARDWAQQRKNRRMVLEMQSKNYPAICLAQKLGWEFCGYNDHYYSNQDIAIFFGQFLR